MKPSTVQRAEKSIAVDFDGVIHRYSKGWHTKDIYDPPMEGAHEALRDLSAAYGVFILTARPAHDVISWCRKRFPDLKFRLIGSRVTYWDHLGVIGVTNRKLPALAYVDDRALRFTTWVDVKNYFR
jgi:hypothetical protein